MKVSEFVKNSTDNMDNSGLCSNPLLILTMVSIVVNLIRLWHQCKQTKEGMQAIALKPTILQQLLCKRIIRNNLRMKSISFEHEQAIYDSLLKTAATLNKEEFSQLVDDASKE